MAKYPTGLLEEELKNKVAADWFAAYDTTRIIGKVDFCVAIPATELGLYESENALWAEAKAGVRKDIHESFVQLILTIGRARTFDTERPPIFLGAFDAEKIAFLPYDAVMDVFTQNDFNWNVAPCNHETKEFEQLYALAEKIITAKSLLFNFESDEDELRKFIKSNFKSGRKDVSRIQITRNNFTHIYQKWRRAVLPSLAVESWDALRKDGIIDADFFLADILSDKDNRTIRKKLYVLLQSDIYEVKYGKASNGLDLVSRIGFKDGQAAHRQFWNLYTRPPRKEYWDFIVERRDLLVDQDVRERKGAFFTPQKWVELSQEYLASELGENWQDEYVIWDCCAGTGNMEAGLTNKYNIWASTLDKADVDVMHTRIKMMNERADGAANLLDEHVFQFDFLNDSFDKLPKGLKAIVDDPEKRKKLVIYINPPYKEHADARQVSHSGKNMAGVAKETRVYVTSKTIIGSAARELFAQFLYRIATEMPGCVIGQFSKLKALQAPNFKKFRTVFRGRISDKCFLVPANTFDNVKGSFPIGFFIWRMTGVDVFTHVVADVYERDGHFVGTKDIYSYDDAKSVICWLRKYHDKKGEAVAYLRMLGTDMQNNRGVFVTSKLSANDIKECLFTKITRKNVFETCVYYAIRHVIDNTWLNDRDQFLFPNEACERDGAFYTNCLVFTVFDNFVQSEHGVNHWIPFTEEEVGAQDCFASHFMSDFLKGKVGVVPQSLFDGVASDEDCGAVGTPRPTGGGIVISGEAKAVLDAGRELWRYYHQQPKANPNASYYDIRKFFQGVKVDAKGKEKMNATSGDLRYNELLADLKRAMKKLAAKIVPKVYEYGFLKR